MTTMELTAAVGLGAAVLYVLGAMSMIWRQPKVLWAAAEKAAGSGPSKRKPSTKFSPAVSTTAPDTFSRKHLSTTLRPRMDKTCQVCGALVQWRTHDGRSVCAEHKATA